MICLDNTDVIEGGASVDDVVDYTIHGLVGTTFTQLAAGVLSDVLTAALYTAGAAVSVVNITLVNTHAAAVNVTLRLDPADGGNPRYMIPKTVSLGIGYSLHTDGTKITVMDASGAIITSAPTTIATDTIWDAAGDLVQGTGANTAARLAKGGALALPRMNVGATAIEWGTGGQIAFPADAVPSADANTLDDYEEGDWTASFTCGTSGTIIINASTGSYIKTGRSITLTGYFTVTSIDAPTGDLIINGLPFTSLDDSKYRTAIPVRVYRTASDITRYLIGNITHNNTTIAIRESGGTGDGNDVANHIDTGSGIMVGGTYIGE